MNYTQEQLRKIDALVAEHIMGHEMEGFRIKNKGVHDECGNWYPILTPYYSTDISAAWEVVKKLGTWPQVMEKAENYYKWTIGYIGENYTGEADTAPLAICLAALKTKGINLQDFEKNL